MSEFEFNNAESTEPAEEDIISVDTGSAAGSILGGLVGMIIAVLLCTGIYCAFGKIPYIIFFLFPFCICIISMLFGGSLRVSGIIIEAVFIFIGLFIFPAFCVACNNVIDAGLSPLSIPLVAITEIGSNNFLSGFSFSSFYVFPVLISIIGIAISWQIFKLKKAKLYD